MRAFFNFNLNFYIFLILHQCAECGRQRTPVQRPLNECVILLLRTIPYSIWVGVGKLTWGDQVKAERSRLCHRGHSTTTWAYKFCHFDPHPLQRGHAVFTLSVDKSRQFLDSPPPPLYCPRSYWMTHTLCNYRQQWCSVVLLLQQIIVIKSVEVKQSCPVSPFRGSVKQHDEVITF